MSDSLDPRAVLAHLGLADVAAVSPVAGGYSNSAIWRVEPGESDDRVYALRLFAAGDERTFLRERSAMAWVRDQRLPVPVVRATAYVAGRYAMLLDWCPGRTILDELMLHPDRAWSLGTLMGRAQGRLHRCGAGIDAIEHGNDWISWVGPDELALQVRVRAIRDRYAGPATVLHLDFHPANVLVQSGRITGMIDWANAGVGDVRADVARTDSILRFAPIPPEVAREDVLRLRRVFRRGWRLAHRRVAGDLPDMDVFEAWALAVMLRDLGAKLYGPDPATAGVTTADLVPIQHGLSRRKARLGIR